MLGGIDNHLFFKGMAGFFALLIIIPLLRWTFKPTKRDQEYKSQIKRMRAEIRDLKRK
jgi:hypothetical protein